MVRRLVIVVAAAVAIGAIALALRPARIVDTAPVRRAAIETRIDERGRTRLPRTHHLTMPLPGRILPITLVEGDRVEAGEVVARVDPEAFRSAVAVAEARIERLRASLVRNDDTRLERSVLEGLEEELVAIEQTVRAADARQEASAAREAYFATRLERLEVADAADAATPTELDEARLAALESNVGHRTDVLQYRALVAIQRAAMIGPRMVREYIEKKELTADEIRHELAEARIALEDARRDLARTEIVAPISGVVLHRAVSDRRVLPAGAPLLELGDLAELQVEVDVLSRDAAKIRSGDPVEMSGLALRDRVLRGLVRRIEPRGFTKVSSLGVEEQRVRVIVALNPDAAPILADADIELGVGWRLRTRIITDRADDALVVPRTALVRSGLDAWQVVAIRGGRARMIEVEVGLLNDDAAQVLGDALTEGEHVILAPERDLDDGVRVRSR